MLLPSPLLPVFRLCALLGIAVGSFAQAAPEARTVESAVVKVFSTLRNPDPARPWAKQEPVEATGSGVILAGNRILTNAHVVLYASQVQVQGHGGGDKVPATVLAVAPGIDLALLQLDEPAFFDQRQPLERSAELPSIKEEVLAYGYPMGGTNLSITKGIISRIEFTEYNFPVAGLRIQVDAAINPGNSGGPAVVNGKMVGLVFSKMGGAQGIGYIIPNEEIELFLSDVSHGRVDAKPALFDDLPTLENPALRRYLNLDKAVQGVVVHKPFGKESPLKVWDVITHLDGIPVDGQGMIQLRPNLQVNFRYLVQRHAKGGQVALRVVRGGQTLDLHVPVGPERTVLVPDLMGSYPPYFVCGPLVFSSASTQFMAGAGRGRSPMAMVSSPLLRRMFDPPTFPGEQLVVIASPFLPHRMVRGYSNPQGEVVRTVNGVPVRNLRHLVELLRDARDEFLVFDFYNLECEALVLSRKELLAATDELLNEAGIRSQGSPELMKVWNDKPAG